jgi:hypothetical protein
VQYIGYAIAFTGVTGYTEFKRRMASAAAAEKAAQEAERARLRTPLLEDDEDGGV